MDLPRTFSPEKMVRTKSAEGAVHLRHPTPDLQALQGAYIGNIERLEDTAERMSLSGSDIGEEIKKIHTELKLSESRRNSLLSLRSGTLGDSGVLPTTRSRNASTSSYSNSIVDVNSAARWGGYSPGGYVTSPMGSVRSGSWSQASLPLQRQRSTSRASRLAMETKPEDGQQPSLAPKGHSPHGNEDVPTLASPKPSTRSSFTLQYDRIAQEIQDQMDGLAVGDPRQSQPSTRDASAEQNPPRDLPDRPPTAASTNTFQQAQVLFHDFDGVHYSPNGEDIPEGSEGSRQSSLIRALPQPEDHGAPPPNDGMTYYPAQIPRVLNLPKRLSQMPAGSVQAQRRSQMLGSLQPEARNSAAWLADDKRLGHESIPSESSVSSKRKSMDPRKSVMSLAGLPPQLRASMYFDHQTVTHEVEVKNESAEITLDSILDASANAPANAFTDHPFAGHVGNEVYGREAHRKSTASIPLQDESGHKKSKSRSSLNLLLGRKRSSDEMKKLQKRNSRLSLAASTELNNHEDRPASRSRDNLSHAGELDRDDDVDEYASEDAPLRRSLDDFHDRYDDGEPGPMEMQEGEQLEEEPEPQFFGPPTTLLAELQMRKAQQRQRNRTAVTAFPNGMHSTLLELDAVAQIEKKKREKQRVNLAWEDPGQRAMEEAEEEDDDVPLGMLFPEKGGLIHRVKPGTRHIPGSTDWDRPLGLMEKRELEDNEPLSRRRNRLRGVDPNHREPSPAKNNPPFPPPNAPPGSPAPERKEESDDDEEETLAQRLRRLRDKEALNGAIEGVSARPVSGEFAAELLGRLGEPTKDSNPTLPVLDKPAEEEEETLGQRRARLQREAMQRQVSGGSNPSAQNFLNPNASRPPLKASRSMADILAAHPAGNQANKITNNDLVSSLPQGSLLAQSEQTKHDRLAEIYNGNRQSSHGLGKPLLDVKVDENQFKDKTKTAAFKGGKYNTGIGGLNDAQRLQHSQSMNMLNGGTGMNGGMNGGMNYGYSQQPMGFQNPQALGAQGFGYQPQPNLLAMQQQQRMGMGGIGYQQPQPQMQMPMMNMGMPMGMGMNMGMPMGNMGMPMGMPMGGMQMGQQGMIDMTQPLAPQQRDLIDRWRQSIMQ